VRILLSTDHYPPYIGGAQIQSRLIARELHKRGHEVVVATVWQNNLSAVEDDRGVRVHRIRQLRTLPGLARVQRQHHQPPFPDPVTALGLRRLIRQFKPDIVHSYGWISYSCAAALSGRNIPMLVTARDYAYSCANRTLMRDGEECTGPGWAKCLVCAGRHYGRPKGWIAAIGVLGSRRLLRRRISAIHCVSTYVQEILRRDFVDDRDSTPSGHVIHDMISNLSPQPEDLRGDPDLQGRLPDLPTEPFLLFIGALRRIKGVTELLDAYELLEAPPPLVLIGTIEADSPTQFPAGVHVLTDLPHDKVMAACRRCLFGVMPSRWPEPFGTVVSEVMSCGKPVIGTTPGGHTDLIIDGKTGFLVPAGDVSALADAMRTLILDPEKRDRFGVAAQKHASLFTPAISLPRIERLYEDLILRHSAA
jgi:glycosyltransferase involved in cell wall biosynthesis